MSIKIICKKLHHRGKPDLSYPAIFCDACEGIIDNAKEDGVVWWNSPLLDGDAYYSMRIIPSFFHQKCFNNVPAGEGMNWDLEMFVFYLASNLELRPEEFKRLSDRAALLAGIGPR